MDPERPFDMTPLHVVILAAGQGKRMRSILPKVLHLLAGRPLLFHVVEAANALGAVRVHVVYGHGGGIVREAMSGADVQWVEQREQLGTGHAVGLAMDGIPDDATVLVLYGDVPLVNRTTLHETATLAADSGFALITAAVDDPGGYGRIVRHPDGHVRGIVEEADASEEQRNISEINTGILAARADRLRDWLRRIDRDNAQGEYYLTDVLARAVEDGVSVRTVPPEAIEEVLGVNDRAQLATLERFQQRRLAEGLMRDGASLADPARVDIRGRVRTGSDVFVDVNVVFEGEVVLGDRVNIGPGCVIRDTVIERDTGGPRAMRHRRGAHRRGLPDRPLRPGSARRPDCPAMSASGTSSRSRTRPSARAPRRTISPTSATAGIGRDVNVGAGVVTCNYDGAHKHETVIGDNAFIGSGVMLVAPVTVHAGATIGAGLDHREGCTGRCVDPDPGSAKDVRGLEAAAEGLKGVGGDSSRRQRDGVPVEYCRECRLTSSNEVDESHLSGDLVAGWILAAVRDDAVLVQHATRPGGHERATDLAPNLVRYANTAVRKPDGPLDSWVFAHVAPRMSSAPFSPIIMAGALMLPEVSVGMIEASTTRSVSMPRTLSSASTTAIGSGPSCRCRRDGSRSPPCASRSRGARRPCARRRRV